MAWTVVEAVVAWWFDCWGRLCGAAMMIFGAGQRWRCCDPALCRVRPDAGENSGALREFAVWLGTEDHHGSSVGGFSFYVALLKELQRTIDAMEAI